MNLSRSNFNNSINSIGEEAVKQGEKGNAIEQGSVARRPLSASQASTPAPQVRQDTDAMAANSIEGREDMPVWQSAFVLGPNVRFTRTPESAMAKRPSTEMPQAATEPETVETVPEVVIPAERPPALIVKRAAVEPPIAKPEILPQPVGARALSYRLRRELARRLEEEASITQESRTAIDVSAIEVSAAEASDAQIDLVCFPPDDEMQPDRAPIAIAPSVAYHLSDYAFWEAVSIPNAGDIPEPVATSTLAAAVLNRPATTVIAPPVVVVSAPTAKQALIAKPTPTIVAYVAPTPLPSFKALPESVTGLYREIGCLPLAPEMLPVAEEPLILPSAPQAMPLVETVELATPKVDIRPIVRPQTSLPFTRDLAFSVGEYEFPPIDLLQEPRFQETTTMSQEALEQSAGLLESVLEDFGVKGEIIDVRPGPVVTLYEFEPAPGVKSSRVIGLSDDIARSMSALSARVAVVPGRNVIGIELPNPVRETVYFRELIESSDYTETRQKLALCLGKTIGGEPVVAELAKMPHLLVAGTTGSGKSVAINTMILSLLYRLKPEECRLIMVDPKMLELSVYDGIPHLLTPVVTDPKKAVMALKWAVREMEDRYRKMSRLGVRNIDGYNTRAATARAKGETILCSVQTGFDRSTGEPTYEQEEMDLAAMPYIVVIVDEMADLMMVAGKEIEGAIQRLAQMARAAGIHLIMATQRPSVDVITGTIKANFPTRISFQVTSKIDSRTILGEQGAEHLLGQGDMLHMMGGGRIARVHGPFVSDEEVEKVVAHLKTQGRPEYLGTVTEDADEIDDTADEDAAVFDKTAMGEDDGDDLYDKAVKVVLRDKKCSTSYIQRRLSIGYNRAASLVERMEQEGLVGPANHVGKRSIIAGGRDMPDAPGGVDIEV
ncbi:S-DNA-T family DNA segregation ATPase FtsK/SpoIIIE [Pararhizobium capsulatum DSM 1112]|uniref:S-DNA-T family DNA segregation ATPase FtsK/SpoIIIE n=1 Tax=Pararhizobium capsulatum DSM 1112 TaxID=1121113 RepID=A0ABU0BXL8_9HYPH|nr:DNA translocase FtsK [Pararhizobium capsulatum]MDQ0322386.1 S-DNA-T family DNA segregation ATPase FtsK/SpoIIIE [Pararhizobium capsulatum DSM 1112]